MKCELTAQGTQLLKPRGGVTHHCGDADHPACIVAKRHDGELDGDPCAVLPGRRSVTPRPRSSFSTASQSGNGRSDRITYIVQVVVLTFYVQALRNLTKPDIAAAIAKRPVSAESNHLTFS
jgi:hypothetical protein